MAEDIAKSELLSELGFASHREEAEAALAKAGLSHRRKQRIATAKIPEVKAALRRSFLLACNRGDCRAAASKVAGGREIAAANSQAHCEICGGSIVRKRVEEMLGACAEVGWRRLCVVGGSPNARSEFAEAVGGRIELRLVDGSVAQTKAQAKKDLEWADRTVVWGSTQLDHKVSNLYTGDPSCTTAAKRGIPDLCEHVARGARLSRPRAKGG
jgi:hypothetical protein